MIRKEKLICLFTLFNALIQCNFIQCIKMFKVLLSHVQVMHKTF